MRKIIALILTACLLSGGTVNVFAQAVQNKQPQSFGDYVKRAQEDKLVLQQAGIDKTAIIGSIIIGGTAFIGTIYKLHSENKALKAENKNLKNIVETASNPELIDFLEVEKYSETFKTIDQAAKDLGADLNVELYAAVKADAYELRNMFMKFREPKMNQFYLDVYRNPEVLKELMSDAVYKRTFNFYAAPEVLIERCPYVRYEQSVKNIKERFIKIIENGGLDITAKDVTLSVAGKNLIKNVLKNRMFIVAAVLLAASSLHAETREQITRLAQNPELAFELNPDADARVINDIGNMQDDTLRKSLIKNFDAAHEIALALKGMTPQEQQDISSSFVQKYKEQTKEYSFDKQNIGQVKTQGSALTGSLNRFTK